MAAAWAIRELEAKDFNDFSRLIAEIYSENPMATKFTSMPAESELKVLLDYKLALLARREAVDYVAVADGRIVAECDVAIGERSTVGIIIEKGMRGKGLGAELLEKSIRRAKELGASSVMAEVYEGNEHALKFFTKNGFSYAGTGGDGKRVVQLQRTP